MNKRIRSLLALICLPLLTGGIWWISSSSSSPSKDTTIKQLDQMKDVNFPNEEGGHANSSSKTGKPGTGNYLTLTAATIGTVLIDVEGAVHHPGVIKLSGSVRVIDAIQAAGGTTSDALLIHINQAAKVEDGSQIYIPFKSGSSAESSIQQPPFANKQGSSSGAAVSLNQASANELAALPGLSRSKAQAIVQYRNQNGPFTTLNDLTLIKGITPKIFLQIKPNLTLN